MTHLMVLALVAGVGLADVGSPPADTLERRSVPVEDGSIRALCTPGPVQVLLLHDPTGGATSWTRVLESLDGVVGACAWTRSSASERGWFELMAELSTVQSALLRSGSGERPRVAPVLVGEGTGGLYARLLAQDRPGSVGGLVLLEPETEGWESTLRRGMPEEAWHARERRLRDVNADGVRAGTLLQRAARGRLPRIPVTALTALRVHGEPGWTPRWIQEALRRRHQGLVDGLPLGRHRPVRSGTEGLLRSSPELVAEEIARVVRLRERTRTSGRSWR